MLNLRPQEIKRMVRDKYSEVVRNPCGVFNFPVGKAFALEDNFFDLVASNGIYNPSPDKEAVMREVYGC